MFSKQKTSNEPVSQLEETLMLIKPDSVANKYVGSIISIIQYADFTIEEMGIIHFNAQSAGDFYLEHREKVFFQSLIEFMTSDKSVYLVLSKKNALADLRSLIGFTDPKSELCLKTSIRGLFGTSVEHNAVHASLDAESFKREVEVVKQLSKVKLI